MCPDVLQLLPPSLSPSVETDTNTNLGNFFCKCPCYSGAQELAILGPSAVCLQNFTNTAFLLEGESVFKNFYYFMIANLIFFLKEIKRTCSLAIQR